MHISILPLGHNFRGCKTGKT